MLRVEAQYCKRLIYFISLHQVTPSQISVWKQEDKNKTYKLPMMYRCSSYDSRANLCKHPITHGTSVLHWPKLVSQCPKHESKRCYIYHGSLLKQSFSRRTIHQNKCETTKTTHFLTLFFSLNIAFTSRPHLSLIPSIFDT